jgi:hypothetical protein
MRAPNKTDIALFKRNQAPPAPSAMYSPSLTIDLAYVYLQEQEVSVNNRETGKGYYKADFNNSANAPAAQTTWRCLAPGALIKCPPPPGGRRLIGAHGAK